jgi:outer membrane protein TolC
VPDQESLPVPSVAPNYEADEATYPKLALIGVPFDRQQSMSMKEVVELALRNNKDIEVSRSVVRSAEATLVGAKGFYDPKLTFIASSFARCSRSAVRLSGEIRDRLPPVAVPGM